MAELSGGETSGEKAVLEKEFKIDLPYGVAKYFKEYTSRQFGIKNELKPKEESDVKLNLIRLRAKFSEALGNRFSRLRKASLRLSYDDIDFCGRAEFKNVSKYASSALTDEERKDAPMGEAELHQLLTMDMSLSLKTVKKLFFDWNPSSGEKGLVKLDFLNFAKNFLKLNEAFVKAGGKDNARLKEIYQQIVMP